jgi:hypothetical protein
LTDRSEVRADAPADLRIFGSFGKLHGTWKYLREKKDYPYYMREIGLVAWKASRFAA